MSATLATTEPTGLEPFTPVRITRTSATERAAFRKCRRQWFLTTVHRLRTTDENLNFWLGDLVHWGLRAFYERVKEGQTHDVAAAFALNAYETEYERTLERPKRELAGFWAEAEPMYRDLGEMGFAMLEGYLEHEAQEPIGDEVVLVEHRMFLPIRHPKSRRKVGELSVQTDLTVRRDGALVTVDHKTAKGKSSSAMLDIDDQVTAEVYITWKVLDEWPEEHIYNALLKKLPVPPEELQPEKKTGKRKLSQRKDQPTTSRLYLEKIKELELNEADYEEILGHLREREMTGHGFYWREQTFRTPGQLAQFEANLFHEFKDMVDVGKHPEKAYPSPSLFACPSCPVAMLCRAMMDESDVSHLVRQNYTVGESRY